VKPNPDQSKHLATACFRLYGLSLDVNNLRTETYTEDSRIPVTSIGTPAEDSQRRDFTVNALFYNVSSAAIEDFTGLGLADMHNKIIRTPLPAAETFRDDPLRMLRAVRFAARLDFVLDSGVLEAAADSSMHELLESKVSRERFGIEVDKMMKAEGRRPIAALEFMQQSRLLAPVFLPHDFCAALPAESEPLTADSLERGVARMRLACSLLAQEGGEQSELRIVAYAALLSEWADRLLTEKKKPRPLAPALLRAALKIDTLACENAQDVAAAAKAFSALIGSSVAGPERSAAVGTQMRLAKEQWLQALALGTAMQHPDNAAEACEAFKQNREWIHRSGLVGCWTWKPLLDGKRLMAPPYSVPRGRQVGEVMELQMQWRLATPHLTEDECSRRVLEFCSKGE